MSGGRSIGRDVTDECWQTARAQPAPPPLSQGELAWLDLSRRSGWVGMRTRRRRKEAECRRSFYGVSGGDEFACTQQVPSLGNAVRVWCFRGSMLGTRFGREASMTKYTHCMALLGCERYPIFIYTDQGGGKSRELRAMSRILSYASQTGQAQIRIPANVAWAKSTTTTKATRSPYCT